MPALTLTNLYKKYPNGVEALKGITLKVEEGDFFGLLGPNGAGKSTAIGIISSLVNKTSGQVNLFGYDLDTQVEQVKSQIGLVPQEFNFNIFEKVQDIVVNQAGFYGIPRSIACGRAEHYLKKLGLWEKRNQQARLLSGGMKRRLMIARGLVHAPKLLVLDEPTAGVDIELRYSLWEYLKELNSEGITIILTTHYLEEAESLCKNLAIIDQGKIVEQTPTKDLLKRLQSETIIIEFHNPIFEIPQIPGFRVHQVDQLSIEVSYRLGSNLTDIFAALAQNGCSIAGIRSKTNRLEELFLQLVKNGNGHHTNGKSN